LDFQQLTGTDAAGCVYAGSVRRRQVWQRLLE
jgi:hypothetical protein